MRFVVLVGFLSVFVSACNNSVGGGGGGGGSASTQSTSPLNGTWKVITCAPSSDNLVSRSAAFSFQANNFNASTFLHSGNACAGAPAVQIDNVGTFVSKGASPLAAGAEKYAFSTTQILLTPLTTSAANAYNTSQLCGQTGWQAGVAKSFPAASPCIGTDALPASFEKAALVNGVQLHLSNDSNTAMFHIANRQ